MAVRARPLNKRELAGKCDSVVQVLDAANTVQVNCKPESKQYTFDHVYGPNSSQESLFQTIGAPLTESCLEGFNGTIIAYGQTGSGKTHTLFGEADSITERGLVPRVFEFLWQKINIAEKDTDPSKAASYSCKCSFYEIYNEKVFDLLDTTGGSSNSGLGVREDQKKGVFVDGLSEEAVNSPSDAYKVMSTGYKNRHVSSTAMNRDSSRSHAVFLLTMTVSSLNADSGLKVTSGATFSLVDLAGSERQKSTQTEGLRLKEASKINQSLSTLGSVIHSLSNGNDNNKFVRYRDSTLTFLLRDSLGGNSKTVLIAAISPSADALSETLGTLKFAQRAKTVRNNATANTFTSGNLEALQSEIAMLRAQLAADAASGSASGGSSSRRMSMYGGRKSMESSASNNSTATANPVYSVFQHMNDSALLSASLNRFKSIDEARMRAELKIHALVNTQKQQEQSYSALQGKVELLERQQNALQAQDTDAQEELGVAELVEMEVSVVREKLLADVAKYKNKTEELERMHTHADTLELWSGTKEDSFRDTVSTRVTDVEKKCRALDAQFVALSNDKFEQATGFSLSEAQSLRSRCTELTTRAEEAEKKNAELTIDLLKSQTLISEQQEGKGGAVVNGEAVSQALNDNAVLLRSFRDVEEQLAKKAAAVREGAEALLASQQLVEDLQTELESVQGAANGDLQQQLQLQECEEALRRLQSDETQKNRDIEKLTFERDHAMEEVEALEAQCQNLDAEKAALEAAQQEGATQMDSLRAEIATLLAQGNTSSNGKLMDAMNLSSQYVSEIARLQENLSTERREHEAAKEENGDLKKEVELNRSVLLDMQNRLGQLREKDFKIRELTATKEELLVEVADKTQQHDALQKALEESQQTIRDLREDCEELQSRVVIMGDGSTAVAAAKDDDAASGGGGAFTPSATVRKLRADLLQALHKVEENSQAHSKLTSAESELRALRLLYEDSKNKASDAEMRAANMMEQLLGVDGDISRARDANADYENMKERNEKLEKKAKKLEKERDAGREVLAQVEDEVEELRSQFGLSESMLAEIRMENTALRESASTKVRETREIKALQREVERRDGEISTLKAKLLANVSHAAAASNDSNSNSSDAASSISSISKAPVVRKRGLSKRDGNVMPSMANLPPPPGGL